MANFFNLFGGSSKPIQTLYGPSVTGGGYSYKPPPSSPARDIPTIYGPSVTGSGYQVVNPNPTQYSNPVFQAPAGINANPGGPSGGSSGGGTPAGQTSGGMITPDGTYSAGYHGSGNGQTNQTSQISNTNTQIPIPSNPYANFDWNSLIQGPLNALGASEQAQQSAYGANVSEAEAARQAGVDRTNSFMQGQERQTNQDIAQQQQSAQSAMNQARQAYSEINQGLQALYGGGTGTGAFASEIAGRQTMQNIGATQQQLANNIAVVHNKLMDVKSQGANAIQQYEMQANSAKLKAKESLDQAIAQIRSQEGALQSQKAKMVFDAMGSYQQMVNEINSKNVAFQQQVALQMKQADMYLEGIRMRYGQTQNNQLPINTSPIQSPVNPVNNVNQGGGGPGALTGSLPPTLQRIRYINS